MTRRPTESELRATYIAGSIIAILLLVVFIFSKPSQKQEDEYKVYNFVVEPGKNGVTQFYLNSDSTATVTYVFHGDTIKAKNLLREEFEELVTRIYPDTIFKETNLKL